MGGDYKNVAKTGMPDMVITSCGVNEKGHLNLDYDLYYVSTPELGMGENVYTIWRGTPYIIGSGLRHSSQTYLGLKDEEEKETPTQPGGRGQNLIMGY